MTGKINIHQKIQFRRFAKKCRKSRNKGGTYGCIKSDSVPAWENYTFDYNENDVAKWVPWGGSRGWKSFVKVYE